MLPLVSTRMIDGRYNRQLFEIAYLVLTLLLKKVVFVFSFSHSGYLMNIDNYLKFKYLWVLGYFGILFALRKD